MSTTYKIKKGDTLSSISKKSFGTEIHSNHLLRANPGLTDILTEGASIVIPELPFFPKEKLITGEGKEGIQIFIDNQPFSFWTSISITKSIDVFDTVTFTAPFEQDAEGYIETFKPFTYKDFSVVLGGETLFVGTVLSIIPSLTSSESTITVMGYSLPAVLHDCMEPSSAYPIEFNGADLRTIAESVTKPFGITVAIDLDVGAKFETVAMKPTETIFNFLIGLAKQRNFIITNTNLGELFFWRSITDLTDPVVLFDQDSPGLINISANFNAREYYSHITGIAPITTGVSDGQKFTDKNPHLTGTVRPYTFNASDTDNANIKTAVNAKFGRMFANMCSYELTVPSWYDKNGNLWLPNTAIQIYMPRVFIYTTYSFIIRSVEFKRDNVSETAVLTVVLPGSFDGKAPENLPWDF